MAEIAPARPFGPQVQANAAPDARGMCTTRNMTSDTWRDVVCDLFPSLSVDWLDERPRFGWLETGVVAGAQFAAFANTGLRVSGHSPPTSSDSIDLVLLLAGRCRSWHAGQESTWGPGDFMLFDRTLPFEAVHPEDFRLLNLRLPRDLLAPMLSEPDRIASRLVRGGSGPGAMLGTYARALVSEADRCDPTTQSSLLSHLCGLVALAVGSSPEARALQRERCRSARGQQVFTYMETHLHDPDLNAARAARDLGMSKRWLHGVLEESGTTFTRWITRRRLEDCKKLLEDPACDHLSITEIAFLSGFNDLSTFYRRFGEHYDIAPGAARRERCRKLSRPAPVGRQGTQLAMEAAE